MPLNSSGSILALDYGDKRLGLAIASFEARLPRPLTTLDVDAALLLSLREIIERENVTRLVVGLPRDLNGNATSQTQRTLQFISLLKDNFNLPISLQDEALTSVKAEEELKRRGQAYQKADIDALAATYILEDWLRST